MKKKKIILSLVVASALVSPFALLADGGGNPTTKLDEVLVTSGTDYERNVTLSPASISVITQEDLTKKPYTSLIDALSNVQGVDVGGRGTINIRGMGDEFTLILIDGKKQNDTGSIVQTSGGKYASLPPLSMIERIEIIKGPMSSRYGSEALGGVINIITKKVTNEWLGSFSQSQTAQTNSEYGNDSTSDFAVLGPLIKNSLGLSLRGSYYAKEPSNPKDENGSGFGTSSGRTVDTKNWTAGAGLTFTPNKNHSIRFDYDISKQSNDYTDIWSWRNTYERLFITDTEGAVPNVASDSSLRSEKVQWSLDYEANWDFGKSIFRMHNIKSNQFGRTLPFGITDRLAFIEHRRADGKWDTFENAMKDPQFLAFLPRPPRKQESNATTYSAVYEMPFEKHFAVIGAEYYDGELVDDIFSLTSIATENTDVAVKDQKLSIYAEDSWNITDTFTLTTGARYEKNKLFKGNLSPKVYAVYSPTETWTIKGGVGTGYRTPDADQLIDGVRSFGTAGNVGRLSTNPYFGQPDLKPETSITGELALYYTHDVGHNFNITLYQTEFKNKIENRYIKGVDKVQNYPDWLLPDVYTSTGDRSLSQYSSINLEKANIIGAEVSGKVQVLDNLSLRATYAYAASEDENGDPLENTAKHTYSATLDWDVNMKFNTNLVVTAEKERWRSTGAVSSTTWQLPSFFYKDYAVLDLNASYELSDNIVVYTTILNLLDTDFTKQLRYWRESNKRFYHTDIYNAAQKRREFWVKLEVTF